MEVGVGILGGGTVGGALAQRLLTDSAVIQAKTGLRLVLKHLAVRDPSKQRDYEFPAEVLTDDAAMVVSAPQVGLVVELMGGLEPAGTLVLDALSSGKPVVTANKELVAERGKELIAAAAHSGVSLLFEAAVGGAIPIIRPLSESLAGERLNEVLGIVNGTTNFILTKMSEDGMGYHEALSEAQELGYAEADPTADVSGGDAASKAAILASLAFGNWVEGSSVRREGITGITAEDIKYAAGLGYTPKLLALATQDETGMSVRVHPTLVPLDHPLATVRGSQNAVYVRGHGIDELLFAGPGAGGDPTATAVLGDVLTCSRELLAGAGVPPRIHFADAGLRDFDQEQTRFYLRLEVADQPGVLAQIASTIGETGVSIESMAQLGRGDAATLLFITHPSREAAHQRAISDLSELAVVKQVASTIRVLPG